MGVGRCQCIYQHRVTLLDYGFRDRIHATGCNPSDDSTIRQHRTAAPTSMMSTSNPSETLPATVQPTANVNPTAAKQSLPKTLVLSYPTATADDQYHRVVVACPKTYQDAVKAAIDELGCYMANPSAENIVLRCLVESYAENMTSKVWVWSDIAPAHWSLVIADRPAEVGVFERLPEFLHGKIWISLGTVISGSTTWTEVSGRSTSKIIDRPKNFAEAVNTVKCCDVTRYAASKEPADVITFYDIKTQNLSEWEAFPKAAYTDERVWQQCVPGPGRILGVKIGTSKIIDNIFSF